ncbi:MAG: hypothetical protein HC846_14390, partial [Blastocatellia bacterium]|nr:hypothetical protein [Blastocatellia bacterium]
MLLQFVITHTEKVKINDLDNSKNPQNKAPNQNTNLSNSPTPKIQQESEILSIKILKTEKGDYKFGLAKIQTTGIKTSWENNGNVPIYGISYLFIESNNRGNSLPRKDISRRTILNCRENQKIVIMPGETFFTLDIVDNRTVTYEVKIQQINP